MDNKNIKRQYEIKMIVTAVICIVGYLFTFFRPNIFVVILFPVISSAFALTVWYVFARFFLCNKHKKMRDRTFMQSIRLTLFSPLFIVGLFILLSMPDAPNAQMALTEDALTVIALAFIVIILPLTVILTIVLGAIAFATSIHHMKRTPKDEGALYRKGPLFFTSGVYVLIAISIIIYIASVLI